jgi:hypothetical protein
MRLVLLLALVGIVGGVGYIAWAKVLHPPEKRACVRLRQLCEHDADDNDKEGTCDDFFSALGKSAPEAVAPTASCVTEARSCGQAVGCVTGGAIRLGTGFARDFADGLERSLRH